MKHEAACPAAEDLSALVDGELGARRGSELRRHALACPNCGPLLREFGQVRADLQLLRQRTVDADLAAIVLARLRGLPEGGVRGQRQRPLPGLRWPALAGLGPRVAGGALAFGVGVYLGMALLAGTSSAVRPAGLSAFGAERSSTLCAGLPSCGPRGR